MTARQITIIIIGILLLAAAVDAAPTIARGINEFKTFLSMRSLLNPCDGAGSPPPCHNK